MRPHDKFQLVHKIKLFQLYLNSIERNRITEIKIVNINKKIYQLLEKQIDIMESIYFLLNNFENVFIRKSTELDIVQNFFSLSALKCAKFR